MFSDTFPHTHSLWMEETLKNFPALIGDKQVDVCVIGSGIAGLTCAYTLLKEGKSVLILDQNPLIGGQTIRTTAHLTWALDDRFVQLEKFFGLDQTKLLAESHSYAIDRIEQIVTQENIDCDFERVSGYLFASSDTGSTDLEKEFEAIQRTGLNAEKISSQSLSFASPTQPIIHFPNQAQFHMTKYINGLTEAIIRNGGEIFNHSRVIKINEEKSTCIVTTEKNHHIQAYSVIVATCSPINNRYYIHTKQAPYTTYVIAALIPTEDCSPALYWDTEDPYHYIRFQKHSQDSHYKWIIVGGKDHKTGQCHHPEERYLLLENWAKQRFPSMKKVIYQWSGQVFEPIDGLAFIGKNPHNEHIYIVTGDSGNGMTHGTLAGQLIPDLILRKSNAWEPIYSPSRKTLAALDTFIKENTNVFLQYKDWLTEGDIENIHNLPIGEGFILRKGVKKFTVYKDKNQKINICSAACPHLGACVRWNSKEKTWDCPCHGSRFEPNGEVINGPTCHSLSSNVNL